jgi:predicted acyl esterase
LPRTQNEAPLGEDYNREVVRWYDHWLKGEETGIMDEPPINLYVTGDDKWRFEQEWPLARTEWTKLHLRRWQSLSQEPEMVPDGPDNFVQQPPNETNEIHHVEYATAPLADDMEITGPVALKMYASIDADDANWIVALEDVYPDGTAVELTRGFLKASHRAVDKDRSKPWEPWHPHLESEPVPPNEVINYDISLTAMSNVFRRGHRIRLRITGSDNPKNPGDDPQLGYAHRPWHVVRNETVLHRVHHEPAYPSHLLVPVIPRDQA